MYKKEGADMTDTITAPADGATAGDSDADYQAVVLFDTAPEAVFDALTTVSGLAGWWAPVSGSGSEGGELRFVFGDKVIRVDAARRPSTVAWTVLECAFLPDWVGTAPCFELSPRETGGCELRFRHRGLTPRLECFSSCEAGWGQYLASLHDYVECDHGNPSGSATAGVVEWTPMMTIQAELDSLEAGELGTGPRVHHVFEIRAPRETVFNALTTTEGLSGWWTTGAMAVEAAVGATLVFTFGGPFNPRMRVVELDPPARVGWEGVGGHAAWGENTTIHFDLDATSGGVMVRFWHQVGRELSEDAIATANFNRGYYLDSLRLLCETGRGKPFQAGIVGARVGASGIG